MTKNNITEFDEIIQNKEFAALVMKQYLKPVEGDYATVFPPTYLMSQNNAGYNINKIDSSGEIKIVCTIDSVGSQANRMEPIFKEPPYQKLVPQVTINVFDSGPKGKEKGALIDTVDLLDAGHRIADAVVRFSDGSESVQTAFQKFKKGDAIPMAKLAPTSLVFGCWDSRGTQEKLPRIVRSTIRAYNVYELKRYSQYFAPIKHYEKAGVDEKELEKKTGPGKTKGSKLGFYDNPSGENPGGVITDSESQIVRDAVLSLSALRGLRSENDENTIKLRRYILGLSLLSFTAPQDPLLRMGCELTADPERPAAWKVVKSDGTRNSLSITHKSAKAYAEITAEDFGVGESKTFTFDSKKANEALKEI